MKAFFFFITFVVTLTVFAQEQEMILSLGENRSVPYRGGGGVWIQDSKILKAIPGGSGIVLKAMKEGKTSLKMGANYFAVQVIHPGKLTNFKDLKVEVDRIVGLKIDVLDGDLVVTGRLYQMKSWIALAQSIESQGLNYQMRAEMSESVKRDAEKYFRMRLDEAKLPPQSVIFSDHAEVRVAGNEALFNKYVKIFTPFGVAVLKDAQALDIAPTVKVQITVAEVRRNLTDKWGIQTGGSYSATLLSDGKWQADEFKVQAFALEELGKARILASPNIICRSGKEAEFMAGGEIPIQIVRYRTSDVVWKSYGIRLKVKPTADSSGRMSISIDTEISTLDKSTGIADVPGILTNHVSSHFDLTRPQTIALSGLLKNEEGRGHNGLPFLSRLPILGGLFSSQEYADNKTELVIFVRPSILKEGEEEETTRTPYQHIGEVGEKL
jgi:Flp pilus assembly protein, secretin CpaC